MPKSELGEINGKSSSVKRRVEISVLVISILLLIILVSVCVFYGLKRRKKPIQELQEKDRGHDSDNNENSQDDLELPLIDFSILDKATDNFPDNNKLGEGGYGPVYKGVLEGGQKGADKMLVYEYMSNKGLDSFIFDGTKSKKLDWATRFEIIKGIARGLVYRHQDSRLRIIHRDLKVSNILFDHEMIPKISYFGMARSFGGNEIQANTNRVVGTYGYMAPEYAGDGIFSIKSDVFSFGVVMLEIVSGKKIEDSFIQNTPTILSVMHGDYITKGNLWNWLKNRPEDRPTMATVVLMLGSTEGELPQPKLPGFFYEKDSIDTSYSTSTYGKDSTNELTISILNAR
ncbi:unnamed protein product [Lactuca saligna]|uniref:Protein kinase domain-containing protein n=1 Tax=Lactuca saligna TaxID=75948 RepID=A0AA35VIK0_LACSI|nr:unnamed protein product [Lactuca saligna]